MTVVVSMLGVTALYASALAGGVPCAAADAAAPLVVVTVWQDGFAGTTRQAWTVDRSGSTIRSSALNDAPAHEDGRDRVADGDRERLAGLGRQLTAATPKSVDVPAPPINSGTMTIAVSGREVFRARIGAGPVLDELLALTSVKQDKTLSSLIETLIRLKIGPTAPRR